MTTVLPRQRETQYEIRTPGSYADYLAWPAESRLVEWVDGEIIEYMPAAIRHQQIVLFLAKLLGAFVDLFQLGELQIALFEVKLWPDGPSREPDVLFVANERRDQLTGKRFLGGPDLVVEVISPGSARTDRVEKFMEYERAGVGEYWLIDSRPGQQQADFFVRGADGRFSAAPLDDDGLYHSAALPGLRLDPNWLRQETLPSPALVMAEIAQDLPALSDEARAAYRAFHQAFARPAGK
jgi:Uma2 family endonuclease